MDYLKGIGFSNYRSIGEKPVFLYPLSRINLFVGPNNAGKSNILNYIYKWSKHEILFKNVDYPKYNNQAQNKVFFPLTDKEKNEFSKISSRYNNIIDDLLFQLNTERFFLQ